MAEENKTVKQELLELQAIADGLEHSEAIKLYIDHLKTHDYLCKAFKNDENGNLMIDLYACSDNLKKRIYLDPECVVTNGWTELEALEPTLARACDNFIEASELYELEYAEPKETDIEEYIPKMRNILKTMDKNIMSNTDEMSATMVENYVKYGREYIKKLNQSLDEFSYIYPRLDETKTILSDEIKKPQYQGKSLEQLIGEAFTEYGEEIPEALFWQAVSNANSKLDEYIAKILRKPQIAFSLQQFGNAELEEPGTTGKESFELPMLFRPSVYSILKSNPVNKYFALQDALTQMDNNGQMSFLPIDAEKNKKKLTARRQNGELKAVYDIVSLAYTGDLDGKTAKIKGYDQSIYNGISSLVLAGNNVFLLDDLCRTVTQRDKVTDAQRRRIELAMQKFSGTRIRMDITQEITEKMISVDGERIQNGVLEDSLLNYRVVTITTNRGKVKKAIELIDEPILLYYSRIKKQIISIPKELAELPGNATDDTIAIRDYLLREINQIKKGYRDNNVINFDSLLKYIDCDLKTIQPKKKSNIASSVCDFLYFWQEKKYIKGHKVRRTGQQHSIVGFEIIT